MFCATFQSNPETQFVALTQEIEAGAVSSYLRDQPHSDPISALIDAIGCEDFILRMMVSLHQLCGASSFSLHHYHHDRQEARNFISIEGGDLFLRELMKLDLDVWRCDMMFLDRCQNSSHETPRKIGIDYRGFPQERSLQTLYQRTKIQERVLLCANDKAGGMDILHLQRPDSVSPLTRLEHKRLHSASRLLFSALAKHDEVMHARSKAIAPLANQDVVLGRILAAGTPLSRREAEVSAGILLGVTSLGIASRLNIGEQTVITYRKRLYQRLSISTQRELMLWYLALPAQTSMSDSMKPI